MRMIARGNLSIRTSFILRRLRNARNVIDTGAIIPQKNLETMSVKIGIKINSYIKCN